MVISELDTPLEMTISGQNRGAPKDITNRRKLLSSASSEDRLG